MKKTAFVTCVKLGLSCIEEIIRIGGKLDLLITLEDELAVNKSGRIYLDDIANKHNIPLLKIKNINQDEVIDKLNEFKIDWLFIIGWSQIAKRELLNTPSLGTVGIHPTLLPMGRGRAAIPWAIIKGLDKTGATLFKLDEGVDTGDIIDQMEISLTDEITATELYRSVNELHIQLISKNWEILINNTITLTKQDDSKATIWEGRRPLDGEIFSSMTMEEADRLVRATTRPYPGAFFVTDKKTIIWKAEKNKFAGDIKLKDGFLKIIEADEEVI